VQLQDLIFLYFGFLFCLFVLKKNDYWLSVVSLSSIYLKQSGLAFVISSIFYFFLKSTLLIFFLFLIILNIKILKDDDLKKLIVILLAVVMLIGQPIMGGPSITRNLIRLTSLSYPLLLCSLFYIYEINQFFKKNIFFYSFILFLHVWSLHPTF